jgi:hypothetical protein
MTWARVDDRFFSHPKVVGTSLAARGLWITALSWSSSMETDGRIPASVLQVFSPYDPDPLTNELVARGLWERTEDGFRVHDFLDWNPSRETLTARRQAVVARVRDYRERKRTSNALTPHGRDESVTPPPSRPVPSPPDLPSEDPKRSLSVRARAARATQWPDDFDLTLERAEVAVAFGLDAAAEWNKFRDHALKDGVTHKNWDAAWRYWCRRATEFKPRKVPWGT